MRFENWDVLLFPEGSKVPLQEFKTNCFVTRDHESPYLQAQAVLNPGPYYSQSGVQGNPGQLPVLTCFLPSLPRDTPFRVSVHSWNRPRPTRIMEGLMQPEDSVMFEVRIFIDGICASASLFNQQTLWPHVIDLSSQLDRNGNQDSLRFPMFHEELLHQAHWDAGDMYGRIRVVISEGFTRPLRNPPFERVRDLIAFSYQHAPLGVLESSGIAWPNPGMWQQLVPGSRHFVKHSLGPLYSVEKDEDAHSHSPTRHDIRQFNNQGVQVGAGFSTLPYRMQPNPVPPQFSNNPWLDRDGPWIAPPPQVSDPFVDPSKNPWPPWPIKRRHSTLDDISMPDYIASSSSSSRVISNTAGLNFSRNREPAQIAPMDDEQYNQLTKAMSPSKATGGTSPPMNTPVAGKAATKAPSAVKDAPGATVNKSQPSALRELSQPGEDRRVRSGSSLRSRNSLNGMPPQSQTGLLSPSPNIRGRKEGSLSVYEDDKENSSGDASPAHSSRKASLTIEAAVTSAESKRKRSISSTHSRGVVEAVSPSSSKKISRRKRDEQLQAEFDDFLSAAAKTDALLSEVELE
ncbi:hypothetical protein A7D00_4593 [Trichophyton violaceum]|uniref:Uncharacterized protein n=1 Tax=Trichophyton violaceum TaxID=34388 RepID=A0A178FES9_TRIVO|nr:hypothetical protein A7D00_4593 [Trichophyton violaceum]